MSMTMSMASGRRGSYSLATSSFSASVRTAFSMCSSMSGS